MKPLVVLVFLAITAITATFNDPTIIALPVTMFTVINEQIAVASNNSVIFFDLNGNRLRNITLSDDFHIGYIATSQEWNLTAIHYNNNSICSDTSFIHLYMEEELISTIELQEDTQWAFWIDDFNRMIVVATVSFHQETGKYQSDIVYYDIEGYEVTRFPLPFLVGDIAISSGNLIIQSMLQDEPAVYIYIADMKGVHARINTTRRYISLGLAIGPMKEIVASGSGIDIYSFAGQFQQHLLNTTEPFALQAFHDYVIFFYYDGSNPMIEAIDYTGNGILRMPYGLITTISYDHWNLQVLRDNVIIASLDDQIKIWKL